MKTVFLYLISFYQRFISPLFPRTCRFYPTCSQYCYEAISKYGAIKGGFMGLCRLMKCHPFHPGGYNPVK
ncbi:MAG: membrane protein insertion efficiency factor YidD [Firmicutes bacterium]|nr:membrane protein insertion efficiency factor YidD [Bacillota bacterium]